MPDVKSTLRIWPINKSVRLDQKNCTPRWQRIMIFIYVIRIFNIDSVKNIAFYTLIECTYIIFESFRITCSRSNQDFQIYSIIKSEFILAMPPSYHIYSRGSTSYVIGTVKAQYIGSLVLPCKKSKTLQVERWFRFLVLYVSQSNLHQERENGIV